MLIRMLYVSTAVGPITTAVTGTILRSAQAFNTDNGITGVLCQGQGVYLQVLEGRRGEVNSLYARIAADRRHKNVQLMAFEDIIGRRYGAWAMAHVDLTEADSVLALNTSEAEFDPYTATGERVMAHIDALIAAGKVMGAPVV
jgi:Sensors of blue-light using FAD